MNTITLFKVLNLAVVLGVVMYAIRRYGILYIFKMIREEKQENQERVIKYEQACLNYDHIEQENKKQEVLYKDLEDKFKRWSVVVESQQSQEQQETVQRFQDIEQKRAKQTESLLYKKLIKKEMPALLDEVADEFKKDIVKDSNQVKKYTAHIMNFIEK